MMNYFLASRGEMTQRNVDIHTVDYYSQIPNNHQSLEGQIRAPRGTLQRPQNHLNPKNSIQGSHETQSMVAFNSFSNHTASLIAAARYGRTLPLTPPIGPRQQMSSHNTSLNLPSHINSVQNFSSNGVGLQASYTSGFLKPSKTTFHNQKNLSYGENSYYKNNSLVFNDFNPHPRVDVENFHNMRDTATSRLLPPIQIQDLDLFNSSGKDLTREGAVKHPLCEIRETNTTQSASKRPRLSFTQPDYFEEMQPQMKQLHIFKDVKNSISNPKIISDARENDEENIDLSLHL